MLDEGLPLLREVGNPYRLAMALNYSGDLARCQQNYAQAKTAYEESITLLRGLDAVRDLASALHNLGHTCLHLGDVERAHKLFSESMAAQLAQHNTPGVAECLIGFAALAVACGLPAAGAHAPLNRDTFLQEMSMYDAAFSDSQTVVEEQIAEGDKDETRITWRGIHSSNFQGLPLTGTQIVMAGTVVQRIKDGKIVEHWPVFDSMGMMQQLGLIPPPQSNR